MSQTEKKATYDAELGFEHQDFDSLSLPESISWLLETTHNDTELQDHLSQLEAQLDFYKRRKIAEVLHMIFYAMIFTTWVIAVNVTLYNTLSEVIVELERDPNFANTSCAVPFFVMAYLGVLLVPPAILVYFCEDEREKNNAGSDPEIEIKSLLSHPTFAYLQKIPNYSHSSLRKELKKRKRNQPKTKPLNKSVEKNNTKKVTLDAMAEDGGIKIDIEK